MEFIVPVMRGEKYGFPLLLMMVYDCGKGMRDVFDKLSTLSNRIYPSKVNVKNINIHLIIM